ncbi:plasmid partitioning protein RepB [Agrobacterium vitis]|uniref:plasmid partitioning protein RepB n=1 Tax=Agrobacterium vitis TaxID=373 RepID=UPI000872CE44|nr:plasmid partitioning protein RepB [Agrobacterium vitis]MCE6078371.1 plasmid partitioning protein RepB [Agrobacterium vitis]MCM2453324.1 plasmid partitioning protein RepB [Agrobacterium vitis]MCM2471783.1 plasmid partitioning protein RepB [Agrobacterium vitis]MUO73368.1 plasmid partitioning protein RepB [Agrobacterium vitis]MUO87567.1 plasmid partitioning protein RepB [Agrobacterium vitis]
MSKRTQSVRNLFAAGPDVVPTADTRQPMQRVASGAVRSLKDTFSEVERDYEELKQRVADGALPIELDPSLIDPSPFADRFADQDPSAVEALKTSFLENGQEIPVLVRNHPTEPGRYQIAYGHRRVRAASELGINVKAYVRELGDDRLILAQGIENSAREDLTFIERSMFALKLEDGGFDRTLIQTALSVDRQEASKLINVGRAVPTWLSEAIGRAPKIGRPRWQELADVLKSEGAETKARKAMRDSSFDHKTSDDRFIAVLRAVKAIDKPISVKPQAVVAKSADGSEIATLAVTGKVCKIQIDRDRDEAFAKFVMDRIPDLYESFRQSASGSES